MKIQSNHCRDAVLLWVMIWAHHTIHEITAKARRRANGVNPGGCNGWSDTLHVWFYGRVFRVGVFSWRQAAILDNFEWPYLRNGSFDPLTYARGHLCNSTAFLFEFSATARLGGHAYKLFFKSRQTNSSVLRSFFVQRVINAWNSLPSDSETNNFGSLSSDSLCSIHICQSLWSAINV